jgi:5'-nucleotidase
VLLFLSGQALTDTNCPGSVTLGSLDSGVADRAINNICLNDLILDAPNTWGSHGEFVSHVAAIANPLMQTKALTKKEHSLLMRAAAQSEVGRTVTVKLIGFNDFHGNIKAGEGSSSNPGVARFATRIKALKAQNPLHAVVSAGDMIGASPLTSALFHDEPTIEAFNRIGIDFNAVGNHEFDEGKEELLRMQYGGNHPMDTYSGLGLPADLHAGEFAGADFDFLAANVIETATGETLLPAYGVKDFLGNKVAFIGMTLEGTPSIVTPSGVTGLAFGDEADTVNALVPKLKEKGIESIVVLVHEGGFATGGDNGCDGVSGPIVDIVNRLHPAVDLVVSGHTHRAYNCLINNKAGLPVRVTSAGQYARNLSNIDLTLDTETKDVIAVAAENLTTGTGAATAEDPSLAELVAHYDAASAAPRARVIGQISANLSKTANAAGESVMGDVIADAQLYATQSVGFGEAVIAFMNPGGIRADILYSAAGKQDGDVTYGEAFTVQPFGNSLVTKTLTGAQIEQLLEQQFMGCPNNQPFNRIFQVSNGFSYAWDNAGPACDKIDPASIKLNGVTLDVAASYRVTMNSFLADGGDLFTVFTQGTNPLGGAQDLDALEAWLQHFGPVNPATYPNALARIQRLN